MALQSLTSQRACGISQELRADLEKLEPGKGIKEAYHETSASETTLPITGEEVILGVNLSSYKHKLMHEAGSGNGRSCFRSGITGLLPAADDEHEKPVERSSSDWRSRRCAVVVLAGHPRREDLMACSKVCRVCEHSARGLILLRCCCRMPPFRFLSGTLT